MKCIVCHGEDIQIETVKEGLKIENDLVYVSVRIPLCHTCGERYYDRRTMQFLEKLNRKLREERWMNLKEVGKILEYV
ncbi:YgiT-type zinc finger protein [Desulfobacterales bacterium HSG2]|nr:YgiT-type zinc finger protein [Desulfobacterales bacterium HSG2]